MSEVHFFSPAFQALTGHGPFQWQQRLFEALLASDIPDACDIPTGLGKTSIIPIWLIALAQQAEKGPPRLPRRLVYVVNRRTVVDQATDVAEKIRCALLGESAHDAVKALTERLRGLSVNGETPLAISTLRGELADNREWQTDPARAAIIIGTVDMIGSRLLFSGYGVSRRMRPFHAGLIGHDALLVHDEAHLTPAFGALVRDIVSIQREQEELRPLHILELSATQRKSAGALRRFALTGQERDEGEVARRLNASKTLHFSGVTTEPLDPASRLADLALAYEGQQRRVLIYVRSPKIAKDVSGRIAKVVGSKRVATLTGTVRGYERDALTRDPLFHGFRPDPNRKLPERAEYLVATSAGEVGVDLDADHLVCDLTTLDSMIQRLGRINRLGYGQAVVQIVEIPTKQRSEEDDADERLVATKEALMSLPTLDDGYDAGPRALEALTGRSDAFSKKPRRLPLTDILLDAWSMTRLRDLPGRPPVEQWLHGVERSAPDLYVAWREEVQEVIGAGRDTLKSLFDKHPILSRERLRGSLREVADELKKIVRRDETVQAILLPANGDPEPANLGELLEDEGRLREATIVLPPSVGGLDDRGMLDGANASPVKDVADVETMARPHETAPFSTLQRARVLIIRDAETDMWTASTLGEGRTLKDAVAGTGTLRQAASAARRQFHAMAEKSVLTLARDQEGEPVKALLLLAQRSSIEVVQDSPAAAAAWQELDVHGLWTREEAERIAQRLALATLSPHVAEAVVLAAHRHDRGKDRPGWQKAIGHPPPSGRSVGSETWRPWAKSGQRGFDDSACGRYRHEFGSLREAVADLAISGHPEGELMLHLIAAHHGWARPHFEPAHWDIADDVSDEENAEVAAAAMRRFASLQRRFGRWGLAWLEALVRSADYAASERVSDGATEQDVVAA